MGTFKEATCASQTYICHSHNFPRHTEHISFKVTLTTPQNLCIVMPAPQSSLPTNTSPNTIPALPKHTSTPQTHLPQYLTCPTPSLCAKQYRPLATLTLQAQGYHMPCSHTRPQATWPMVTPVSQLQLLHRQNSPNATQPHLPHSYIHSICTHTHTVLLIRQLGLP